jgi:hypothetical protein
MDSTSFALDLREQPRHDDSVVTMQCLRRPHRLHEVKPLLLSVESLREVWEAGRQYKTIFGHDYENDFWKFVAFIVDLEDGQLAKARGLPWVLDDYAGLFYLTNIIPGFSGTFHYCFFKYPCACSLHLINKMLGYLFNKYELHRISMEAPLYMTKGTFSFIEQLGFTWEGRERSARLFDGRYFHINHYGLLRDEYNAANIKEGEQKE